jgi:hypothetical protein
MPKMKFKIGFFIFIFFQTIGVAAQDMTSLKTEALKSYKASVTMNFEDIFETTYPKVFEIIPQDQMKTMFGQMMENEQFSIKLVDVEPGFSFGEIKKIEDKMFCFVNYNNVMIMKFKTPVEDAAARVEIFKSSMEADKVTYDKANNSFQIEMRSTLLAVADDATKNKWKFINKDKKNKMFSLIFNEKTVKAIGL